MRKQRYNYSPEEKVQILKRHLVDRVPISDLCDEYLLQPTVFYDWQKRFFENGSKAFDREKSVQRAEAREIENLKAKLTRKHEVLSELMEEHVRLKKEIGEL
jgi:transposase-like protein